MKKGFTLMEVLFVLLVIALVLSFALPAFRSVRYDVQNARAKNALRKLVEARRSFYQYNKGTDIVACWNDSNAGACSFVGNDAQELASAACNDSSARSGIPSSAATPVAVGQLFACQFLDWKDFKGIYYTFKVCPIQETGTIGCEDGFYAAAIGGTVSQVGANYASTTGYYLGIDNNLNIVEEEPDED